MTPLEIAKALAGLNGAQAAAATARADAAEKSLAEAKAAYSQASSALSNVSGALADAGMPVGPAVDFSNQVRALAKDRDDAHESARMMSDRLTRLVASNVQAVGSDPKP